MDLGTAIVLVFAALFFGGIVLLSRLSRKGNPTDILTPASREDGIHSETRHPPANITTIVQMKRPAAGSHHSSKRPGKRRAS